MTKEEKQKLIPLFGYAYYMRNRKRSDKFDETTAKEFLTAIKTDAKLADEIANAAKDPGNRYDTIWSKAEELATEQIEETQSMQPTQTAKSGAKLEKLKKLRALKTPVKKKCKCGCDMITVKAAGGKMTSQCSCNCGGGKIKVKAKGGVLFEDDINYLRNFGIVDPSISNKWERKINSHKLGKFKK